MSFQLSPDHKLIFAKLVMENKAVLFGRRRRKKPWIKIFNELKSTGANLKDLEYLENTTWRLMVENTLDNYLDNKSTRTAPVALTEVDEVIVDIFGRDSVLFNGIPGVEDHPPSFAATNHGVSTQGSFNFGASTALVTARLPAPPSSARASTSGETMEVEGKELQAGNHSAPAMKKKRKGPPIALWMEEEYKKLKIQQMTQNLKEQVLRIELMRFQIDEAKQRSMAEKARATFFEKAGMALDGQHHIQITNSGKGKFIVPL